MTPTSLPPHVLIADDDPEILALLEDVISGHGCRVTAIERGDAAYRALQAGGIDLLITDLMMPDLNGFELLAKAQAEQPDLPVLVITSSQSVQDAVRALKQGALDYLQKPFNSVLLRARVYRLILQR